MLMICSASFKFLVTSFVNINVGPFASVISMTPATAAMDPNTLAWLRICLISIFSSPSIQNKNLKPTKLHMHVNHVSG